VLTISYNSKTYWVSFPFLDPNLPIIPQTKNPTAQPKADSWTGFYAVIRVGVFIKNCPGLPVSSPSNLHPVQK